MIKYSLYLTEKQEQRLRILANESNMNVSEHIRTAINNYLRMIEKERTSESPSVKKD